jgi:hypothetical protein
MSPCCFAHATHCPNSVRSTLSDLAHVIVVTAKAWHIPLLLLHTPCTFASTQI